MSYEKLCNDPHCHAFRENVEHRAHLENDLPVKVCECGHFNKEHEWNVDWPGGIDKFPGLNVPDEFVGTCKKCKCKKYKYKSGIYYEKYSAGGSM